MSKTFQSRGFVCKTVSADVLQFCLRFCEGVSGARWAYAQHVPPTPKVLHWHFVGLFEDRVYWKSIFDYAMEHDRCSSTDNCKKPRKAVRYLLHLDSPDKHPVPRDAFISGGMWGPDELENWLESSSVASSLVDTALSLWRDGCSPLEALSRLVSFGYEPYQISASLQAFSRLHEFFTKYAPSAIHHAPKQGGWGQSCPQLEQTFSSPLSNGEGNESFPTFKAKNKPFTNGQRVKDQNTVQGTARNPSETITGKQIASDGAHERKQFVKPAIGSPVPVLEGVLPLAEISGSVLENSHSFTLPAFDSDFRSVFPSARIEKL